METPVTADELFSVVADVANYAEWLELVSKIEPAEPAAGDPGPAWFVTLRAAVGPLSRSKRLRMVVSDNSNPTRFELKRQEVDGRDHSPWILASDVAAQATGSDLTLNLHYGGKLWNGILDSVLERHITATRPRLLSYLTALSTSG